MSTEKKPYDRTTIIAALIVLIGTVITAIFASPWISKLIVNEPPPTPSPTAISSPQSDNRHPPLPLEEIFRQVGDGKEFMYINAAPPEDLRKQFVTDERCRHSGPHGLKLTYKFTGAGHGGWGVGWKTASAGSFNASEFTHLRLWVKGLNGSERFQLGLKDTRDNETKFESDSLVINISNWSEIVIPLNKFTDVNLKSLENISFGFNSNHGSGDICIDDIAFVK